MPLDVSEHFKIHPAQKALFVGSAVRKFYFRACYGYVLEEHPLPTLQANKFRLDPEKQARILPTVKVVIHTTKTKHTRGVIKYIFC